MMSDKVNNWNLATNFTTSGLNKKGLFTSKKLMGTLGGHFGTIDYLHTSKKLDTGVGWKIRE